MSCAVVSEEVKLRKYCTSQGPVLQAVGIEEGGPIAGGLLERSGLVRKMGNCEEFNA